MTEARPKRRVRPFTIGMCVLVAACAASPQRAAAPDVPRDKWPVAVAVEPPRPAPLDPPEPEVSGQFAKCHACHSVVPGRNLIGPSLAGVFGRQAGSTPGYRYSAGLAGSQIVWDEATLEAWLTNPRAVVPDTKMAFYGLRQPEDRAEVIAFLKTL